MSRERRVRFSCGDISLEGVLQVPTGGVPRAGAVLCHPHPLYGGTMDNNVVLGVGGVLLRSGVSVLRFNFRGAGESGGEHGGGIAEREDVAAAMDYLADTLGVAQPRLAVVGYSFGAAVGLPVGCEDPRVGALVAVAPPLSVLPVDGLEACDKPKLALVGSADAFCPAPAFRRWFDGLAPPKESLTIAEADHFLAGREREVGRVVAAFLARHGLGPDEPAESPA